MADISPTALTHILVQAATGVGADLGREGESVCGGLPEGFPWAFRGPSRGLPWAFRGPYRGLRGPPGGPRDLRQAEAKNLKT